MDKHRSGRPNPDIAAQSRSGMRQDRGRQRDALMDRKEYAVGRFTLQPFRQLLDSGSPVAIKPKALAILSVLAGAEGALVTKDQLMETVWPNITVEDNAIQAHVAILRKILGTDAELLSTVHGLGYRLAPTEAMPPTVAEAEPKPVVGSALYRRGWLSALAIVLAAGAMAGSLLLFRGGAPVEETAQLAIAPFDISGPGPGMEGFGSDLRDKISAALSDARILVASGASANQKSEFLLGGRITSDGKMLDVHVQISDAKEHVAVWSGTFRKELGARMALLTNVAASVADAAHFAVIARTGKVRLNAAAVAAFVEASNSLSGAPRNGPALERADYQKIIALAPESPLGHSGLAVVDAFQVRSDSENETLRSEARREANRALVLDPRDGEAYVALELILPPLQWKEREALLRKSVIADPDFEPAAMMEARLLWSVGRGHDALPWFDRAYNLNPLHADNAFTYAASLASEGKAGEGQRVLKQMDAQLPDHSKTRDAHFWASLLSGATGETLAIVADPVRWPLGMNQKSAGVWRAALTAQASKDQATRAHAIRTIEDAAADASLTRGQALLLLSMLNDVEGAFAQAQFYEPADPKWAPFLFLGPTEAMRFDRRFMALAVKFGFAAYWRATGQWPDFCQAPGLPYDCKAEVDKLAEDDPELKPQAVYHPVAGNY
jgi:DNA-binding winged helix-turn-helix (wHTH) protein/TolB-like protein